MKSKYFLRVFSLLILLVSLLPARTTGALPLAAPPPVDMFQLPWDLGIAWVAIDGIDNGTRRPLNSSHHWSVGGAIDFAPHNNMRKGEDTSNFWVTAATGGIVIAKSFCHVKIDHGSGWTTEYQFLANIQVNVGDAVSRNQRLGIIADGVRQKFCPGSHEPNVPHLHFMLRPSLRNATLAGWEINYLPVLNKTTFRKNGQTLGLFKPLLNTLDQIEIVSRGPILWDTLHSGNVDPFRHERWSLTLDEVTKFTLTATPTTSGLIPLIRLLDMHGNEISRNPGTLTSTQPAGDYLVQIQSQAGNGSYTLLAQRNDLPSGPFVLTSLNPASVIVGAGASAVVQLNNVPAEGFTSTEFTCTYNAALAEVGNIIVWELFGSDPVVAIREPQNGSFIVAIAGSKGNKATVDGIAFTFSIRGLQAGQTTVECQARVSQGNNVLTAIDFIPGSLTITGSTSTPPPPTPGTSPTAPVQSPVPTLTSSPTPGETHVPTFTFTPDPGASLTPTPSPAPMTPTISPTTCDHAEFTDLNVPPGTAIPLGTTFTKTWLLRNVGSCTWTPSYQLAFFGGDQMGAPLSISVPFDVAPGQLVIMEIPFTAPTTVGHYTSLWKMHNASGVEFGVGASANDPVVVDIIVADIPFTPTITPAGPVPTFTPTPVVIPGDWLTFTNSTYGFQFRYPKESQIVTGGNDNSTLFNLPFTPGTNLSQKYLQMTVVENANPCRSPLASSSIPQTSETVVINGITFLKETGEDGTAGHMNTWTAYSTTRGHACVSLDFVLRAANPGVFNTPPPLYDEAAESLVFGQIVSTYQWLDGTSTSTPTPGGFVTPTSSTPVESVTPVGSPTPTSSTPVMTPTSTTSPSTPTGSPTSLPDGTITGTVIAGKPVTVSLYDASNVLVTSVAANPDGTFSLTAPAGTYTITATASGFLRAEGSATIAAGSTSTKPTLSLLAGDIDGNGVIDQFDALTIGMSYNTATPPEADLNNDGVINVLDLELLARNYRKAAPQDWN